MALADLLLRGAGALGQRLAATQQPQAPTTPNPLQTAFTNALVNPNMPIEAGFRTPSEKTNADLERQARIRNQLAASRAAIIERARAQGRQVNVDPNTGQLVIGDVPQTQIVQPGPDGTRIAYRNGIPVGFSSPARPSAEEMRFREPYRSDPAARAAQIQKETAALPAEQRASIAARLGVENTPAAIASALSAGIAASGSSVTGTPEQGEEIRRQATALAARQRAAEIMRSAVQKYNTANAVSGSQMTPTGGYLMTPMTGAASAATAAPAPTMAAPAAPALPLPTTPARPTPMPSAPFRDATGRVDTAAVARAQGRTPVNTVAPPVTPEQVDAALAEAEMMQEAQTIGQAERQAAQAAQAFDSQIADLTRRLTAASRAGNRAEVVRLTNSIRRLRAQRAGQLSSAPIIEAGSPMF